MINLKDKSPKILVIGDLMIDHYLWGSCERVSPEAPVQIIKVDNENSILGGAGNVIKNLKSLGADVGVIGAVGDCNIASELIELLHNIDIDTKYLFTQKNLTTTKKTRIVASQQQVVRYDQESNEVINKKTEQLILDTFNKVVSNYDCILLSDYGKGVLTSNLTKSIIQLANKSGRKVLIDPKGHDYSKYKDAFLLTPNLKEASQATNIDIDNDESLSKSIKLLKSKLNLNVSIITLSERGIASYINTLKIHPTFSKEVFDVTGAGDTVLASLGFALASELDINSAIQFANLAAGVVVGKIGSATVSIDEIIEYESSQNKSSSESHIKTFREISILSKELKIRGKKIIFTNGCFDLLHAGHIKYLEIAKSFGDVLILGLNSDRSVKAIKGSKRPINTQTDRAYILAALEVVDYVVVFDENTPYELIKAIKPNILVKGGDYKGKEVIGEDIVDELKLVEFMIGKSSTKIINQIQKNN